MRGLPLGRSLFSNGQLWLLAESEPARAREGRGGCSLRRGAQGFLECRGKLVLRGWSICSGCLWAIAVVKVHALKRDGASRSWLAPSFLRPDRRCCPHSGLICSPQLLYLASVFSGNAPLDTPRGVNLIEPKMMIVQHTN